MPKKKRLIVVTNIPSPYRLHEFSILNKELINRGVDFEAIFLAKTERGRDWVFDSEHVTFPFRLAKGRTFYIKGIPFIFNPLIIGSLIKNPPTWLWLGGSWYLPTIVVLSWLMRLRQTYIMGWNENTLHDNHILSSSIAKRLRDFILKPYMAWIVHGPRAREYIRAELAPNKPTIVFKNTVDEKIYRDRVAYYKTKRSQLRQEFDIPIKQRVFLWVARLSSEKGILPFLDAIKHINGEYTILIAGEGPQRQEIKAFADQNSQLNVRLLGHQNTDNLLKLYALADVLLFLSISETFGFAALEALWAGLHLLLSDRIGSLPQVLHQDVNGWVINYGDNEQAQKVFQKALDMDARDLAQMGEHSLEIAQQEFDSEIAVNQFVDDLLQTLSERGFV